MLDPPDSFSSALTIFFWNNMSVFTLYSSLASFILLRFYSSLDRVSLLSIGAVWLSFFIRFLNWLIFKVLEFKTNEDRVKAYETWFLMIDSSATTIFLLNAYFFCFEMKSVHEQIISKTY